MSYPKRGRYYLYEGEHVLFCARTPETNSATGKNDLFDMSDGDWYFRGNSELLNRDELLDVTDYIIDAIVEAKKRINA